MGIKISPSDNMGDSASPHAETSVTYTYLIEQVVKRGLGYVCLSRRGCVQDGQPAVRPPGTELPDGYEILDEFGPLVKFEGSRTSLMVNYEYGVDVAGSRVREGRIDLVAFGKPFIHNPVGLL